MFLKDRLQITSERKYTDEGFLIVPARISRTGIQEYLAVEMGVQDKEPTDIIKVYRPEEEVFSDKSLSSFANKPVTDNHPPELVNSINSKNFTVGHAGPEIVKDGMFAKTTLYINDAEAISKIEGGKVELSNGYTADIEWTPGISPNGEHYDAVQRNIKGNHIAIVERGRAGSSCRVADNLPNKGDVVNMAKITVDGVDFEVSDQAAQAVGKLQVRLADAEEETKKKEEDLKDKEDEVEEVKKEAKKTEDSLQAKLDDAKSKVLDTEAVDKLVADRSVLVSQVNTIAPDLEWEGKDSATLKKEVVGLKCPNVQMDSVSDDYVDARFDMLLESVGSNGQQQLDNVLASQVKDSNEVVDTRSADAIAREKMMADSRNAWKSGGAK